MKFACAETQKRFQNESSPAEGAGEGASWALSGQDATIRRASGKRKSFHG